LLGCQVLLLLQLSLFFLFPFALFAFSLLVFGFLPIILFSFDSLLLSLLLLDFSVFNLLLFFLGPSTGLLPLLLGQAGLRVLRA
jgi:hypothetical protein